MLIVFFITHDLHYLQGEASRYSTTCKTDMTANNVPSQSSPPASSQPTLPVIVMDVLPPQQIDCGVVQPASHLSAHQSNSGEYCMLSILQSPWQQFRFQMLRAQNEC